MEIYIVQQGDTINSIANRFGVSVEKIIVDNEMGETEALVIGQTLVITDPVQVHFVEEGDTLAGIAEFYQVPVLQILRNNSFLAGREYIYPGEMLTISYNNDRGNVWVTGYTYPFIRNNTFRKTLPYLTYLLILNYRITSNGQLTGSNDDLPLIETAKWYNVATSMVVTAYSEMGVLNVEIVYEVLLNEQLQEILIDNMLGILQEKNYNGVNLAFQIINETNQQLYLNYLIKVWNRLHSAGYLVYLTLNPNLNYTGEEVTFDRINYGDLSDFCDGILFLSYDWGFIDRPPIPFDIISTALLLDYIIEQVPRDKIRIVLPTLGYDWQLPYVAGITRARVLNFSSVLELARENNAIIRYEETSLSAYFEYVDIDNNQHIVWFKDARSIDSSLRILQSYGIEGIGIWNIMYYFAHMWLVINTQYEIRKI